MKKKILLVTAVVICLAIAATGTLAYFTAENTAHNVIKSGSVNIEVVEKTLTDDGVEVDFPANGFSGIMPGSDVSKIVSVKNTGENDAWVRVLVEAKITAANGEELPLDIEDVGPVMDFTVGENWKTNSDRYFYYSNPITSDRYFYYSKPIKAGESTEILFDTIHFAPEMGNEYQGCTANIVISAQAVQTAHNGETVTEAAGWPALAED